MTVRGRVKNGLVVLEPGSQLPEGSVVEVTTLPICAAADQAAGDPFRMAELAVETGIPDLGTNADHYLYGHPKVDHAG